MSDTDLERLERLLEEALGLPSEQRERFLDEACGDETELRGEIDELLTVHGEAAGYFDHLAGEIASAAVLELDSAVQPRFRIGPYRTIAPVGHGGMGVVYRAERVDGAFDQQVAVKLLHRDMETPDLSARFLAERQLLAGLSHPNIARLQDGGVTDEGRPYFVMEYVEGRPLTRYCRNEELSVDELLRLFLVVVNAVSYLHRNLVVHRDLKPSNILVDRDGQVKLLDFGIAKLLAETPEAGAQTRTGEHLMTPQYAAPEQLTGDAVTTATDVYALGCVLYELLTGVRPNDRPGRESRPDDLPPTPSFRLRAQRRAASGAPSAADQPADPTAPPWRRIDSELDAICMKALRPEPEARYQSADQMVEDIGRYLDGLPIRARRGTLGYRAGKFVRRHRTGVIATAGLIALLVVGFAHERSLRAEAEQAREVAQRNAATAESTSDFLQNLLSSVDPLKAQGREVTVADVLEQAAQRIAANPELADQPEVEAALRQTIGTTYTSLGRHEEALQHLERAVELRGGLEAPEPAAVEVASDLAVAYARLGRHDDGEAILRRVVEVQVERYGEDARASLTAMNRLADLLWAAERFDEVEAIDRRTLEIRRRTLGDDHPDTLKSLNGLAATQFTRGSYADAAATFGKALESARRQLGESHPHTITLANNLAAAYLELGDFARAEALFRDNVRDRTRVLGPEHHETGTSLHNLGVTLAQQARFDEAEDVLRRAIEVRCSDAGNPGTCLFSRSHLADVYRDQGRFDAAEDLYTQILGRQRSQYGQDHRDTLKTAVDLAELRLLQCDLTAAEELLTGSCEALVTARSEGHPDTLHCLTALARVRFEQGRLDESLELSARAIDVGERDLGPDHPVTLAAVLERARILAGLGRTAEATELRLRVVEGRTRIFGEDHPKTREARELAVE